MEPRKSSLSSAFVDSTACRRKNVSVGPDTLFSMLRLGKNRFSRETCKQMERLEFSIFTIGSFTIEIFAPIFQSVFTQQLWRSREITARCITSSDIRFFSQSYRLSCRLTCSRDELKSSRSRFAGHLTFVI